MASLTRTGVWASSGSWWWTGKPGMLQSMGLQKVGHDWATELNWTEKKYNQNNKYNWCWLVWGQNPTDPWTISSPAEASRGVGGLGNSHKYCLVSTDRISQQVHLDPGRSSSIGWFVEWQLFIHLFWGFPMHFKQHNPSFRGTLTQKKRMKDKRGDALGVTSSFSTSLLFPWGGPWKASGTPRALQSTIWKRPTESSPFTIKW